MFRKTALYLTDEEWDLVNEEFNPDDDSAESNMNCTQGPETVEDNETATKS